MLCVGKGRGTVTVGQSELPPSVRRLAGVFAAEVFVGDPIPPANCIEGSEMAVEGHRCGGVVGRRTAGRMVGHHSLAGSCMKETDTVDLARVCPAATRRGIRLAIPPACNHRRGMTAGVRCLDFDGDVANTGDATDTGDARSNKVCCSGMGPHGPSCRQTAGMSVSVASAHPKQGGLPFENRLLTCTSRRYYRHHNARLFQQPGVAPDPPDMSRGTQGHCKADGF